jgi:hypothetical protein
VTETWSVVPIPEGPTNSPSTYGHALFVTGETLHLVCSEGHWTLPLPIAPTPRPWTREASHGATENLRAFTAVVQGNEFIVYGGLRDLGGPRVSPEVWVCKKGIYISLDVVRKKSKQYIYICLEHEKWNWNKADVAGTLPHGVPGGRLDHSSVVVPRKSWGRRSTGDNCKQDFHEVITIKTSEIELKRHSTDLKYGENQNEEKSDAFMVVFGGMDFAGIFNELLLLEI